MSFHESFWLAASAAAPVSTLATVVAIPDAAKYKVPGRRGYVGRRGSAGDLRGLGPESAPSYDTVRDRIDQSLTASRWAVQVTKTERATGATRT